MNIFGSLILAGIVMTAIIVFYIQPWRTTANFCSTYNSGKSQLIQQWSQQENAGSDSFSKLVGGFATVAGEPNDLANFFDKLDGVSPKDIEPDVATLRDAFKKESDSMTTVASGNFLAGIASGLMLGLSTQGAFNRVDAYISRNCGTGQRGNSAITN